MLEKSNMKLNILDQKNQDYRGFSTVLDLQNYTGFSIF